MFLISDIHKNSKGQATIEAAIMIPVIFLLLLLLLQPSILLYDWIIMNEASSETCRVVSTVNENDKNAVCESYARRRLSAIPQQDNFHVHSSGCSYEISLNGNNTLQEVEVEIKNQVKPLPIIGFLSEALGILNDNKCFLLTSKSKQQLRPDWISSSPAGVNAENWVGGWLK